MLHIKFLLPVRGEGQDCPVLDTGMRGDKNERPLTSILSPGGERIEVSIQKSR